MHRYAFTRLLICLVVLALPVTAQVGLEDYVAYWDFDEGQGMVVGDQSANNLTGTAFGATWTPGVSGSALSFNGFSDFVSVTDGAGGCPAIFSTMGEGSISVWLRVGSITPQNQIHPILYVGDAVGGPTNQSLIVEVGHFGFDAELYFTVLDGTGAPIQCYESANPLQLNTWYHFVAVVGSNYNTGFLNGVEMTNRVYNNGSANSHDFFQQVPNQQACWFGRGKLGFYTMDQWLDGAIDEMRIYDRPLNGVEAQQLYVHPTQTYPGTLEDFVLQTGIDGAPCTTGGVFDIKQVVRGHFLDVRLSTPGWTFAGAPVILGADLLPSASIVESPLVPGLWLRLSQYMTLVDGTVPGPLGYSHVVTPGGVTYGFQIPVSLPVQSLMVQAGAFSTNASNGVFALSEAHEIQILQ